MVKVKMFGRSSLEILEDRINEFVKDKILYDVKLTVENDYKYAVVLYAEHFDDGVMNMEDAANVLKVGGNNNA